MVCWVTVSVCHRHERERCPFTASYYHSLPTASCPASQRWRLGGGGPVVEVQRWRSSGRSAGTTPQEPPAAPVCWKERAPFSSEKGLFSPAEKRYQSVCISEPAVVTRFPSSNFGGVREGGIAWACATRRHFPLRSGGFSERGRGSAGAAVLRDIFTVMHELFPAAKCPFLANCKRVKVIHKGIHS